LKLALGYLFDRGLARVRWHWREAVWGTMACEWSVYVLVL